MYYFIKNNLFFYFMCMLFISNSIWSQNNDPPIIVTTGDQPYCPLTQLNIATEFDIGDPDNNYVEAVYIQISSGYVLGQDFLSLTGDHPNITATWSASEGKLTLRGVTSVSVDYWDIINATRDVIFESTSPNVSGEKFISFTIGDANYLPSNGHYYEYVSDLGITWTAAKTAAEARNYYGLQGYLATLTFAEEAQLAGKQAAGTGWIGGSDAATEGVWKWVTGPEDGTIFWNGLANGSTPNFAFWNNGEPNNLGNEDYAHITAPNDGIFGSWNDLSNTGAFSGDYQPKGYIVEYGGMPGDPELHISASSRIFVPAIDSTEPTSICESGTATLSATATEGTVLWFDAPTGGTPISIGSNFTTPLISNTTTYYAYASVNGCSSGFRIPVVATVNQIPTITTITETTICGPGSGILAATASAGILNWYSNPTGGISIGTGNTFSTPTVTNSTTYYVDASENSCTTSVRTPVNVHVEYTAIPSANTTQTFCENENASIADLLISGINIKWYASPSGGSPLTISEKLITKTYYATQTQNGCESTTRLGVGVTVYEAANPTSSSEMPNLTVCDDELDGDGTNGFSSINITTNATTILNGQSAANFSLSYFTDGNFLNEITNPSAFLNTVAFGQTIYVRMRNNLDATCYSDTSFQVEVFALPDVLLEGVLKNCDEDGVPDGFTDFNLNQANAIISYGDNGLTVSYYRSFSDASTGADPLNPSPYNNMNGSTVYARAENTNGCYSIATIDLQVATTSFPVGYIQRLQTCDEDNSNDGLYSFDLTQASANFISQFPTGQNLSVHYFRNLTDAQLEQNEILSEDNYINETPFLQNLYVRVESNDNGDCYGIGEHLTLTVHPRPTFTIEPSAVVCLNLPAIILETQHPEGVYTYQWTDETGIVIGVEATVSISSGGTYTVIATSDLNCESFPQTVTVIESNIAAIEREDVTIVDNSANNTILIHNENNNLGEGDYEFALDNGFGIYQEEPFFEMVIPGIHTILVKDKNNCGIAQLEVFVLGFPNFFTPNNDGINDRWQIQGLDETDIQVTSIYIFDRFGKVLSQIDPKGNGWDGIFNGNPLPAEDYWYAVQLLDQDGIERNLQGHFSLIRK